MNRRNQSSLKHRENANVSAACVWLSMCIDIEPARSLMLAYREGVPAENPRAVALQVWPQRFLSSLDQVRAVPQSRSRKTKYEIVNYANASSIAMEERIALQIVLHK